jgi:hypothetical protein
MGFEGAKVDYFEAVSAIHLKKILFVDENALFVAKIRI